MLTLGESENGKLFGHKEAGGSVLVSGNVSRLCRLLRRLLFGDASCLPINSKPSVPSPSLSRGALTHEKVSGGLAHAGGRKAKKRRLREG